MMIPGYPEVAVVSRCGLRIRCGPSVVGFAGLDCGIAVASCSEDPMGVEYVESDSGPPPVASTWAASTSTADADIEVPSNNAVNSGAVDWFNTGISISEPETYMKITVEGQISVSANPEYTSNYNPHNVEYAGLTAGPYGVDGQLRVYAQIRSPSGQTITNFGMGPGDTVAYERIIKINGPGSFWARRTFMPGGGSCVDGSIEPPWSCPGGSKTHSAHAYDFSGEQSIKVETFEPFQYDFPAGGVAAGDSVTATTTTHSYVDSLGLMRWYFKAGDTLSTPSGYSGGSWLYAQCPYTESCTFSPSASGRLYLTTRVHTGGTYFSEVVHSEVIWVDDGSVSLEIAPLNGSETLPALPGGAAGESQLDFEVSTRDGSGPVSGYDVALSLTGSGVPSGHQHDGDFPEGGLSQSSWASFSGEEEVTFAASAFAGEVWLKATSRRLADSDSVLVTVRVPALSSLSASTSIGLIGDTDEHPGNQYGTSEMLGLIQQAADAFYGRFGRNIEVNDISITWGGKFDLNSEFSTSGGHAEHRTGESADVRTHGGNPLTDSQKEFLRRYWEVILGRNVLVHPPDDPHYPPHFHLRARRGGS